MISRAVIIKDCKILLMHRLKAGKDYYVFPGGHIEHGETQEETLVREVKEETGFNIKIDKKLWDFINPYDNSEHHFFKVTIISGKLELGEPELSRNNENNKYILEWHNISKISELIIFPNEAKDKLKELM